MFPTVRIRSMRATHQVTDHVSRDLSVLLYRIILNNDSIYYIELIQHQLTYNPTKNFYSLAIFNYLICLLIYYLFILKHAIHLLYLP